jgi:hypothetical protein
MKRTETFWALVEKGKIVNWRALPDGEEGLEIHRTRRLAYGSRMGYEKVVKVKVSYEL